MHEISIIPVIAIEDANKAVPLAKTLMAGGLPAAEVTFRTAAGEGAIHQIAQSCPEVLVGAGTILNEEQCDHAIAAGQASLSLPAIMRRWWPTARRGGFLPSPAAWTPRT